MKKIDQQTEQKHLEAIRPAMTDDNSLHIGIKIRDAWVVITGLQLAASHPGISQVQKNWMIHVARQLQASIVAVHPEVAEIIEMGWHREYDQPVKK
jgi:hypothetical protein